MNEHAERIAKLVGEDVKKIFQSMSNESDIKDWEDLAEKALAEIHKHTTLATTPEEVDAFNMGFHEGLNHSSVQLTAFKEKLKKQLEHEDRILDPFHIEYVKGLIDMV